jgi:hypothetical protein
VRTCRQRRWWWRRVGEARGRRTPTPSPRRERMPFRRLPSAASGGGGHHAIEAAGDGAAAIPSRGSGRGGERVIGVEKNGGGPAPRIYFSLYNLSLSSFRMRCLLRARARCVAMLAITRLFCVVRMACS